MKKLILFLLLPFAAMAQDTTKTPNVNNLSAKMWWDLQKTVDSIGKERNFYYESYVDVRNKWLASNDFIKQLQDSVLKLNLIISPKPITSKLRGLNVHFGKNTYPDYTADKISQVIKMNQAINGNAFRCDVTLNADGSAKYPIFDQFADSCRKYKMKIMAVISQTSADGAGFTKKYGDIVTMIQYGNELDNLFELTKIDTNKVAKSWADFMNRFARQANIDAVINFSWTHYITPTYFKSNVSLINSVGIDNYNDSESNSIGSVSQLGQALARAKKITGAKKYGITEIGFLATKSKTTTQDQFYSKVLPLYQDADFIFLYEALNQPLGRAKSVIDEQTLGLTPESIQAISKLKW